MSDEKRTGWKEFAALSEKFALALASNPVWMRRLMIDFNERHMGLNVGPLEMQEDIGAALGYDAAAMADKFELNLGVAADEFSDAPE